MSCACHKGNVVSRYANLEIGAWIRDDILTRVNSVLVVSSEIGKDLLDDELEQKHSVLQTSQIQP
jgi:hypothetical protein